MPTPETTSARQTFSNNLGALQERVAGTERGLATLSEQLENLANSINGQINSLASKMDAQAFNYAASRSTNWTAFFSTAAAVAAVLLTIGSIVILPISNNLTSVASDLKELSKTALQKDDFHAYALETNGWIASLRDRLKTDEDGAVTQRQFSEFRDRVDERARVLSDATKAEHDRLDKEIGDLRHDYAARLRLAPAAPP